MTHLLDDLYLKDYEEAIRGRAFRADAKEAELLCGQKSLSDWANAHEYYGLHLQTSPRRWVFRELAPNATNVWLVGDFSDWKIDDRFKCERIDDSGVWQLVCPYRSIRNGDNYRLEVEWATGRGERIPAYARYVVQDAQTGLFAARVWVSRYKWHSSVPPKPDRPIIYEAHIGMGGEEKKVHSYNDFRKYILPKIAKAGYNTLQLMAIMEHPYYASFGYHVSSFFAASSRFGSPDELKKLIDAAHRMGLRVIMDLVHSHAVKNERDGLSCFDGTDYLYFHSGSRGVHSAWDSRLFDYGKTNVLHFLISNCKFWLDEYHFDGFRFDGVTSMLFYNHGLGDAFTDYSMYFNGSVDDDAWVYLRLANRLIHETRRDALTVAEDVSGMPGVAASLDDCGLGFDYRMAMGEPDFWFKLAEKTRDEDWSMGQLMYELTNKRAEEKVVSYVESHDQALVGGKTFLFELADAAVYFGMKIDQHSLVVDRAIALHKMARLATFSLNGGAYLNFMGNEFGHPEWIDFPREGNNWSYSHARRQWSLREDKTLYFSYLADFDKAMLSLGNATQDNIIKLICDEEAKVLAFIRWEKLFVFNFNHSRSHVSYELLVPPATKWQHHLDTDEVRFAGQGRIEKGVLYSPKLVLEKGELVQKISLYIPARCAIILTKKL